MHVLYIIIERGVDYAERKVRNEFIHVRGFFFGGEFLVGILGGCVKLSILLRVGERLKKIIEVSLETFQSPNYTCWILYFGASNFFTTLI